MLMPARRSPLLLVLPQRPRVRGDCLPGGCNEQRPCPWVGCRYHLALDVNADGALVANQLGRGRRRGRMHELTVLGPRKPRAVADRFGDRVVEAMEGKDTCALDVAEQRPRLAREVAELLSVKRDRIRQIEDDGKAKMQAAITGKPMAAQPVRVCRWCGQDFTSTRWQLYCSTPCKQEARAEVVRRARERWQARQVARAAYKRWKEYFRRLAGRTMARARA